MLELSSGNTFFTQSHVAAIVGYQIMPKIDRALDLSTVNAYIKFESDQARHARIMVRKHFFTKSHVAAILDIGLHPKTIGHLTIVLSIHIPDLKAIGRGMLELSSGNTFSQNRMWWPSWISGYAQKQ